MEQLKPFPISAVASVKYRAIWGQVRSVVTIETRPA